MRFATAFPNAHGGDQHPDPPEIARRMFGSHSPRGASRAGDAQPRRSLSTQAFLGAHGDLRERHQESPTYAPAEGSQTTTHLLMRRTAQKLPSSR